MGYPEAPLPTALPGWWPGGGELHVIKTSAVENRVKRLDKKKKSRSLLKMT